jgi:hypothetical protein
MVAARTSQADTVQYKNNEQYNTQKKNSNTEQYNVTEQYRTQNTQQRKFPKFLSFGKLVI